MPVSINCIAILNDVEPACRQRQVHFVHNLSLQNGKAGETTCPSLCGIGYGAVRTLVTEGTHFCAPK